MGGLLAVVFYCLIGTLFWYIAKSFRFKNSKNPARCQKVVFIFLLMTPLYYHTYELIYFWGTCYNTPVIFPDEKIDRPNILITGDKYEQNEEASFRGTYKFEYLVSPENSLRSLSDLHFGKSDYYESHIYADGGVKITKPDQRKEILREATFGFYSKVEHKNGFYYRTSIIYDYLNKEKVSSYTDIGQAISDSSIRNFITLIRMPRYCPVDGGKYWSNELTTKFLFENTFKAKESK